MPRQFPAELRTFTADGPLALSSGGQLARPTVGYQSWGTLNAARDNVILVCHALTGTSDVASWWEGAFGAGRVLDPSRHFILCINNLGSCYGSSGPDSLDPATGQRYGSRFPQIEIADIVAHQRLLVAELGIRGIELVVGASMGGFIALEWARSEPTRVRRVAVIASSWRQPPQALAQARLQCEFIRRDPNFAGGDYLPEAAPNQGLALARQLGHLTYRSPEELDRRFGRELRADGEFQVLSYLDHQGDKLVRRFDALCYLRLTEAMNRFDLGAGGDPAATLAQIRQPALVVALSSDQLYFPSEQARLAGYLANSELLEIDTLYGHDGFLVDAASLDPGLRAFRDQALPASAAHTRSDARPLPLTIIGATGRVGAELLALLAQRTALPLRLVGVANSRGALWQPLGIDPTTAVVALRAHATASAAALIERFLVARGPAVLVDCTASAEIASYAPRLLAAGIALVTPNKLAFAAGTGAWSALAKALAGNTPAGWSATVGAGLPILSTIGRLRAAGDELIEVEAGLSGTLGHLLTRTQNGSSLAQAIDEAIALGLAEPDPRADLGGEDVRRKLSIILRAAGIDVEPAAIALEPLLALAPEQDWRSALADHEDAWSQAVLDAKRARLRLVYRARWSPETGAVVGPALVAEDHPLAGARGTENRVVLRSHFQGTQPIVISGAGAGVRVTAAAVLADLISVTTSLQRSAAPVRGAEPVRVPHRIRAYARLNARGVRSRFIAGPRAAESVASGGNGGPRCLRNSSTLISSAESAPRPPRRSR